MKEARLGRETLRENGIEYDENETCPQWHMPGHVVCFREELLNLDKILAVDKFRYVFVMLTIDVKL